MAERGRLRSCYLTYPAGRDVSDVRAALGEFGLSVREGVEPGWLPAADAVQAQIANSDLTVAVLAGGTKDGAVLFELGVARGLQKPTLVVAIGNAPLPSDLIGARVVSITTKGGGR